MTSTNRTVTRGYLVDLATDVIKLVGSLTPIPPVDEEGLRRRFVDLLTEFHARAVRAGYADDLVDAARAALSAFVDDQVRELDAPIARAWAQRPLGRGDFTERLAALRTPGGADHADALEVCHLCLCLGTARRAGADRQRLIDEIGREIRAARGGATSPLSPAWEPRGAAAVTLPPDRWRGLPLWVVPAALAVLTVLVWLVSWGWMQATLTRFVHDVPVR